MAELRWLAAVSLALLPAGVAAGYKARTTGAWTVSAGQDGTGCFVSRDYDRPGGTRLLLGLDKDGSNRLTVLNANWSIEPQEKLNLDFRLSKGGYPKQRAIGLAADGRQGFVTAFERRFPDYFARSAALHIDRGKVPVERLALDGSGAAVAELRRCVAAVKIARRGAQPDVRGIPADPFAPIRK